jgi:hypothetical protein
MRSDTKSISIQATPEKVVKFLADPLNLPRWAVGFAKSVREEAGRWLVTTGSGEMAFRIEVEPRLGVVDFYMSPAQAVEALAASRVLPNAEGSEYVFTQFQAPGVADHVFEQSVRALAHELTVLRAVIEVECAL